MPPIFKPDGLLISDITGDVLTLDTADLPDATPVGFGIDDDGALPAAQPQVSLSGVYYLHDLGSSTYSLHIAQADALDGSDPIAFTDAGSGQVRLHVLSVRQRILRTLASRLSDDLGIDAANVQFWDATDNQPDTSGGELPGVWVMITVNDTDAGSLEDEGETSDADGYVMPLTIDLHLSHHRKPRHVDWQTYAERWIRALTASAIDHRGQFTDNPGGENFLAADSRISQVWGPIPADDQRDIVVGCQLDVFYRHPEGYPHLVR